MNPFCCSWQWYNVIFHFCYYRSLNIFYTNRQFTGSKGTAQLMRKDDVCWTGIGGNLESSALCLCLHPPVYRCSWKPRYHFSRADCGPMPGYKLINVIVPSYFNTGSWLLLHDKDHEYMNNLVLIGCLMWLTKPVFFFRRKNIDLIASTNLADGQADDWCLLDLNGSFFSHLQCNETGWCLLPCQFGIEEFI